MLIHTSRQGRDWGEVGEALGCTFKEVFTLGLVQMQGWHLTLLPALDGCYMKKGSVANKDRNISLHILTYCMALPSL